MKVPLVARRPWLLVWVAFFLLVAVWTVMFVVSRRVSPTLLSPTQEAALLEKHRTP